MLNLTNDPIDVFVSFIGRKICPRLMHWGGKTYEIRQVNLIHTAKEGAKKIFYFSVSDDLNYFKLRLDSDALEWRLVEVYTDS